MSETVPFRDFFISFNSADLAYAQAIDTALSAEGFTTFYHPRDLGPGGNIPIWMDDALMNSAQTLALYSPDYTKDNAVYSKAERYASWWQDPGGDKRKLIPILIRETTFTPLMAMISRIDVRGLTPQEAAAQVIARLKTPNESKQRDVWRAGLPLPQIFHAIYPPNPNFTGRFEALESLQRSLRTGTNAAVTAVAGMGGIGKTTLAAEYCHRFGGRYGGVWWIRAEQEPVILGDLQALGQKLGLQSSGNIEVDARASLDHLASLTQPWLLVYDNAPNPDGIRKWLPTGAVRCLITSRFTEFGQIAPVTRLDEWSDEVTVDYLISRTGRTDTAGAVRLAKRLGGLPLGAEQAAAYLSPRAGVSFDDYAAEISRLIKRRRPAGATGDYPDTVYAAFVKSLETVAAQEGGKTALDLLRLCAFLSPDGIDLVLLTVKWGHEILPESLATEIADKFAQQDALAALASLSLLRQEDGPAGLVLILHRLLLEVVRDWMGEDARALWGGAAVELVSRAFPDDVTTNPVVWPLCARLMPHIAPLALAPPRTGQVSRALDRLLNQACAYLVARGDDEGALTLGLRSVALARLTATDDPLGLATSLNNVAGCYSELNRLKEAEQAYTEVLEIADAHLAPGDSRLAMWTSNLAEMHWRRRDFAKAEPLLLRAAEIMKAALGPESADYGSSLCNLGALYGAWAEETGQPAWQTQEKEYKTQALTVVRAARGERHPETAVQYHNLAVMKARVGDWYGAAIEQEREMAIMLSLGLMDHPRTRRAVTSLADFWLRSDQIEKVARLRLGDTSDLLPVIKDVETAHRAWVAKDPQTRHFGPPSRY